MKKSPMSASSPGRSSLHCGLLGCEQAMLWSITMLGTLGAFWVCQDCTRHLTGHAVVAMLVVFSSVFAVLRKNMTVLWWTVLVFSLLKNAVVLRMSSLDKAPSLFLQSGWTFTVGMGLLKTYFNVPQLLMLNLQGFPLLCLMTSNAGATAVFYCTVLKHSCLVALLQAAGSQMLWYYILVAIRGMHASSDAPRGSALSCNLPKAKQQQVKGSVGEVHDCARQLIPLQQQPQHQHQQQWQWQQQVQQQQQQKQLVEAGHAGVPGALQHSRLAQQSDTQVSPYKAEVADRAGAQCLMDSCELLFPGQRSLQQSNGVHRREKERPQVLPEPRRALNHSIPGKLQPQRAQLPAQCYGFAQPIMRKTLAEASRTKAERPTQQRYSSRTNQCGRLQPNMRLHHLQQACRMAVKISGPSLPEHVPGAAIGQLQCRLQRYHHMVYGEAPAVRAGCLVLSFGVLPVGSTGHGLPMQEVCPHTVATIQEWAQEHGLMAAEDDSLTVQACHQADWGIASSPSGCSMALHTPFLITSPSSQDEPALVLRHTLAEFEGPAPPQEQEASCQFELTIAAPPKFDQLRGWQCAADAPEELPEDDGVKRRSLSLLASVDGQFVPTFVEQRSMASNGERVAQACVRLPGAAASCPKVVMLELWAAGSLVCSYSAMLLPSSCSGALAELQGMEQGVQGSHEYIRDLVSWARFQALSRSARHQQQQGGLAAAEDAHMQAAEAAPWEQLALMSSTGKDLLEYSLSEGMLAVAGLLLEGLMDFPFCMPTSALLEDHEEDHENNIETDQQASLLPDSSTQQQEPAAASAAAATTSPSPGPQNPSRWGAAGRQASLWTSASHACIKGFEGAPNGACQVSDSQQQQQQQQQCLADQPSEEGYRKWGAHFSQQLLHIRFNCCSFGCTIALLRAVLSRDLMKVVFMFINFIPYAVNCSEPQASLRTAKYTHMAMWSLMGLGLCYMEANTRNMVNLNADAFVLVLFFSPSFDQGGLRAIVLERMLTTVVIALLCNKLQTWCPLLRSLTVNALAFTVECAVDVYFRFLYLQHLMGQRQSQKSRTTCFKDLPVA
ncbi:hypothetical protein DUNSADRAFT_2267 [Dunaliella salina]|uniref:Uncharacterized protein n=1 Tax=Dunaliella salina TaxID=3046 RepID=A0ABQ7FWH9_DUNSA|nr:hypothetical protein DUNSADRAFT_2267 [Dunaliella salina]|eukprot:KAF5826718.1 hypothetical protein DUNSADRAFT_2267 [Dunaliella salina]